MNFHQPNLSTTIAGLAAIVLFLYFLTKRNGVTKKSKTAPVAPGGWPLLGHIPLFSGNQLPHVALGDMADKCGPIFNIQLGTQRALVVSSPEMAEDCFTTNDAAVSSRPKLTAPKYLTYNYAMFVFGAHDAYWREMRKIATSELLSGRQLELFKKTMCSEVEASIKELHKMWSEKKDASGHVLVDMKEWFWNLSFNVMVRMIVGKRYSEADDSKPERIEARKWRKAITEFFRLMAMVVVSDAFPFLEWLDVGGHVKAMKGAAKDLDDILDQWLEEHRRRRASGQAPNGGHQQDFMDVMLSVLDGKDKVGAYDVATVNKATCMTMVAGGTDSTSDTLTWALSLLLNNCQALRKLEEELNMSISGDGSVKDSDISKLTYLQAIIKETLRMYPPFALIPRETCDDCTIGGYHVPKGTYLMVNAWKIQNDSRSWSYPFKFKPEWFLTTHKSLEIKGKNFELLPFGSGRRGCPGIVSATQLLPLALASFLHEFEISTPSNAPVDITAKFGFTNVKADSLEVLIKPRRLH